MTPCSKEQGSDANDTGTNASVHQTSNRKFMAVTTIRKRVVDYKGGRNFTLVHISHSFRTNTPSPMISVTH